MTTNGTLINKEIVDYLKINNVEVSISMDGDEAQHNATRRYKNGEFSYSDVCNGIELLKQAGILSLVEVTHSAKHENVKRQLDGAFQLYSDVSCACVDGKPGCLHEDHIVEGEDMVSFYNEVLDFEGCLDHDRRVCGVSDLYRRLGDGSPLEQPYCLCTDIGSRLVIFPDGNISPCPEMSDNKYSLGNVNKDSESAILANRHEVLEALSSSRVKKHWFSSLIEACIQHVYEENGYYEFYNASQYGKCIESLLARIASESYIEKDENRQ